MVKHQDVILGPSFFLCDRFSVFILLVLKLKKKETRKPDLPVEGIDITSNTLWFDGC